MRSLKALRELKTLRSSTAGIYVSSQPDEPWIPSIHVSGRGQTLTRWREITLQADSITASYTSDNGGIRCTGTFSVSLDTEDPIREHMKAITAYVEECKKRFNKS